MSAGFKACIASIIDKVDNVESDLNAILGVMTGAAAMNLVGPEILAVTAMACATMETVFGTPEYTPDMLKIIGMFGSLLRDQKMEYAKMINVVVPHLVPEVDIAQQCINMEGLVNPSLLLVRSGLLHVLGLVDNYPLIDSQIVAEAARLGSLSGMFKLARRSSAANQHQVAAEWYLKTAARGHLQSKYNLALMKLEGHIGTFDEGLQEVGALADAGNVNAMECLACTFYIRPEPPGKPEDFVSRGLVYAKKWVANAPRNATARYLLGQYLVDLAPFDYAGAYEHFVVGAGLDHPGCMFSAAYALAMGLGCSKNVKEADTLFSSATTKALQRGMTSEMFMWKNTVIAGFDAEGKRLAVQPPWRGSKLMALKLKIGKSVAWATYQPVDSNVPIVAPPKLAKRTTKKRVSRLKK